MPDIDAYRSAIERVRDVGSYESADRVIDAYHKLHDLGYNDLDNLVFKYARFGIENKYVNYVFETYLIICDYCIDKLTEFKFMFEIIDEYGEEAISIVKAEELMDEAEAHQEKGNFEEVKKCLEGALELKPWDEEIKKRISELSARRNSESSIIPKELGDLVKKLSMLESMTHFSCTTAPFKRDLVRHDGLQEDIYCLGERIVISIESPEKRDGFLTVFHYDDDYNLSMIYPDRPGADTSLKAGTEKRIGIIASKPLGRHYLKAFWTSQEMIDPDQIGQGTDTEIVAILDAFIATLRTLRTDDWIESVAEFEVKEK